MYMYKPLSIKANLNWEGYRNLVVLKPLDSKDNETVLQVTFRHTSHGELRVELLIHYLPIRGYYTPYLIPVNRCIINSKYTSLFPQNLYLRN